MVDFAAGRGGTTTVNRTTTTGNSCPEGQYWSDQFGGCVANGICATGYHWDDASHTCMQDPPPGVNCGPGFHWVGPPQSTCVPDDTTPQVCSGGQVWSPEFNRCVDPSVEATFPCPTGQHRDPTTGACVPDTPGPGPGSGPSSCGPGQQWIPVAGMPGGGYCDNAPCPSGQTLDPTTHQCVSTTPHDCGTGKHWDGTTCVWDTPPPSGGCPAGQQWNGTACVPIPVRPPIIPPSPRPGGPPSTGEWPGLAPGAEPFAPSTFPLWVYTGVGDTGDPNAPKAAGVGPGWISEQNYPAAPGAGTSVPPVNGKCKAGWTLNANTGLCDPPVCSATQHFDVATGTCIDNNPVTPGTCPDGQPPNADGTCNRITPLSQVKGGTTSTTQQPAAPAAAAAASAASSAAPGGSFAPEFTDLISGILNQYGGGQGGQGGGGGFYNA